MPLAVPDIILPPASATISALRSTLDETFSRLDDWCGEPEERLRHRPPYPLAWTAAEHLEHVSLANHFLLLTIGKGVATALRRARVRPIPTGESDLALLIPIADPAAFPWEPPGHMIPGGRKPVPAVRNELAGQLAHCRMLLEQMGKGEGALCSFRMSVFSLGRLDMYQWLCFLAQHARWHLEFLVRRESQHKDDT